MKSGLGDESRGSGEHDPLSSFAFELVDLVSRSTLPVALYEGRNHVFAAVSDAYRGLIWGRPAVGLPFREVLPELVKQGFETLLDRVFETGESLSSEGVTVGLHQDGAKHAEQRIVDFTYEAVRDARGEIRGVLAHVNDRTEAARRDREREFLANASDVLASSLDYEQTLTAVANLAVQGTADWCAVDELLPDGTMRRIAVAHPDPAMVSLAHELNAKYPPDPASPHGVFEVLRTGRPEMVSDIPEDFLTRAARSDEHLQIIRRLALKSYIIVPLLARGSALGALTLVTSRPTPFGKPELRVAEELARRAAVAIDNARLFRAAVASAESLELQRAQLARQAEAIGARAEQLEALQSELEFSNRRLEGSRARLQITVDSSLDAIITIDTGSVIQEWNRQAEVLFGWKAAEVVGTTLHDTLIPVRYREAHLRGVQHFLATGEGPILNRRIEIEALRRDGAEFPVELTVTAAVSEDRRVFTAFLRDITEKRRAEAEHGIKESVTLALAESRTLREAAPRVLEALGTSLGWQVSLFWVLDRHAACLRAEAVWTKAPGLAPEFVADSRARTFARGAGLPGRVWEQGKPTWIADVAKDGNFIRGAIAAREGLHGAVGLPVLSGDEFIGVIEFFHDEPLEPTDSLLRTLGVLGGDIAEAIRRLRAEQERDRALENVERINRELEQLNAALQERTGEAETANQAKSTFLSSMSHELRTPINAIMGYADLLEMRISGPLTDAQAVQLGRIRSSSRHLIQLIEEVLDFSKIEAGKMRIECRESRLGPPVAAACDMIEVQAGEKGLHLERPGEVDLDFMGDEDRVRQIVVNLLSNAVKFTPEGGSIRVRSEAAPTGNSVLVRVEDTGTGIPADQLESIFVPFVQLEAGSAQGGTGLGLSISRQLARMMGGDLTAASEPGVGSTFTLVLPKPA